MQTHRPILIALLLPLLLCACSAEQAAIADCEPRGALVPHCDMQTPEDIAAVADGRHLLLAHFGHMGESAGSIALFDTRDGTSQTLYPKPAADPPAAPDLWGEADCSSPPTAAFSPHGTHLHQLEDGRWRYLVINHGAREAVELFELQLQGPPRLAWRGCVRAAGDSMLNDVVGLDNGDLVYSRMYRRDDSLQLARALLGMDTGELWYWQRERGLRPLSATAAAYPNGLEISADNRYVFANMYMENQVWQVELDSGSVVARIAVDHPDNSSWAPDGRLWVASHRMSARDLFTCFADQTLPCGGAFSIVAVNTASGATESVFSHEGPPMGAATVAVAQNGRVYLGSFAGDRMLAAPAFE